MNYRLLCGSCHRLRGYLLNGLNSLSGLGHYLLGSRCRCLLNRLRLCNLRLCHPGLPCSARRSNGGSTSGGTALLIEEHATAANRLESARTLLATLLTVSRRRLGRTSSGRTSGCRANGTHSLRRRGRLLASSSLGCILRCLHRDVRTARACRLTVQVAGRLAGSGLAGSGARLRLRSLRIRAFSTRAIYRFGCIVVGFVVGAFVPFILSVVVLNVIAFGIFCFSLGAALIAVRLHLMGKRLQQTKTAHRPRATGKNQEEDSPTPRQTSKECQKAGDQGKHAQTGGNQQGNTARA